MCISSDGWADSATISPAITRNAHKQFSNVTNKLLVSRISVFLVMAGLIVPLSAQPSLEMHINKLVM